MDIFKRIFKKRSSDNAARFNYPFFLDSSIQAEIAKKGYSVQTLLTVDDVKILNKDFFELVDLLGGLPDTHWTSGRVDDPVIRNFARRSIEKILPLRLEHYFNKNDVDFIGGIFLAKKPSPISELSAHQDSSHTDETRYPAVYAWVALTDTNETNGAFHVLPGSHLWGNRFRSLNVPWAYNGFQTLLNKELVPVYMRAGDVLFFDSATIHYSANNLSDSIRPAINYFIKPKQALFLHHYIGKDTPTGKVEVYNVDIDFFYDHDFMQAPPCPPYTLLRLEDDLEKISTEKLKKLISARVL